MKNLNKSKITVIGFVAFVLSIYLGSYFYTKSNNERLLSSPRLVLMTGDEKALNDKLIKLNSEQRNATMRSMYQLGNIYSVSQKEYVNGETNISEIYLDNIQDKEFFVADCMEYSALLKKTMEREAKSKMRSSWVFAACGIIE